LPRSGKIFPERFPLSRRGSGREMGEGDRG
jgi:hypothetical protein